MKLNLINFIKPSKGILLSFLALFTFFSVFVGNQYIFALCDPCSCNDTWGYPLQFAKETRQGANLEEYYCGIKVTNWNITFLLLDIIFWYVLSASLLFAYKQIRSKHTK